MMPTFPLLLTSRSLLSLPSAKGMWDERILWAILVALLSKLFYSQNGFYHYVAQVIILVLPLILMLLKPHQPMVETQDSATPSPEIQVAGTRTTAQSAFLVGPSPSRSLGFFHRARNIVINNSTMTDIQGEDRSPRIMESLLKYIIIGAAHDDSARSYPPRCHPGTRVQILERLIAWFHDITRLKSLLWLSGPAGVGKSAIMQTFAESVKHPVASVFVSRSNERNDPNRIFTTIAYQLAVHIEAYRNYIVDRIAANPYLLEKNMQIQFQVFITEPFVERKIGAGGPPLAILLDGLDEVEGAEAQRIIRFIGAFTQEHPDVPLSWIIASRPEPHISNTFNEVIHESEPIPIDSTQACNDVERFLRDSFVTIRHDFPSTTLRNWPEETALAKLAAAASGLFIFAETAIRFIRDPDYANPVPRLKLILSVIDRSKGISIREQPFVLLDNLYGEILSKIPLGLWPTTKLLIGFALFFRNSKYLNWSPPPKSRTLRGMSMILQLDHHTVYAALNKCFSMLSIPSWEKAHTEVLMFLHASFPDYLTDSQRSGEFYIDVNGVEDDVLLFYLNMWHKYFGENPVSYVNSAYERDNDTQQISQGDIDKFKKGIFEDMAGSLITQMVERHKPYPGVSPALQEKRLECLNALQKVNMISLCDSKYLAGDELPLSVDSRQSLFSFARMTFDAWQKFPHELGESGFLRQVSFKDINFNYQDKKMRVVVDDSQRRRFRRGPEESTETFLKRSSDLLVLICGTVPGGRVALFKGNGNGTKYCIVPFRE